MVKLGFESAVSGENIAQLVGKGKGVLMGRSTEELDVIASYLKKAQETGNKVDLVAAAIDSKTAEKQKIQESPYLQKPGEVPGEDVVVYKQNDVQDLWNP